MEYPGFVFAAWGAAALSLGGYAVWVLRRGRRLSEQVPEDERRWSDS
jgi:heme exporter protein CcmD